MHALNKVPQVTLGFWIIKILATTFGETGGDALSMTLDLGYAVSTAIFFVLFIVTATAQIASDKYRPFLYWTVIAATTTAGTTISDYLDRTAGLGYPDTSLVLFLLVLLVLAAWRLALGTVSVNNIASRAAETFYWLTILVSNTLGTALGDFAAESSGLGFEGGALVFGAGLALIALAYFYTNASRTMLFWSAFVLTRPLGATLGDLLTKPHDTGGLAFGRVASSLIIAVFMIAGIWVASRRLEDSPAG